MRVLLLGGAIALLLTGCDVVEHFLNDFPQPNPTSPPQPSIPSPSSNLAAQSPTTAQMEALVEQQINHIRQQHGLNPLRHNEKLGQVAREYSRRMAVEDFFSHTSPQGDTMVERVHNAKIVYLMIGENLFMGTNLSQPAQMAVNGWMNSPGHRENVLRQEFEETGIGVWKRDNTYYFTQLFMQDFLIWR